MGDADDGARAVDSGLGPLKAFEGCVYSFRIRCCSVYFGCRCFFFLLFFRHLFLRCYKGASAAGVDVLRALVLRALRVFGVNLPARSTSSGFRGLPGSGLLV